MFLRLLPFLQANAMKIFLGGVCAVASSMVLPQDAIATFACAIVSGSLSAFVSSERFQKSKVMKVMRGRSRCFLTPTTVD